MFSDLRFSCIVRIGGLMLNIAYWETFDLIRTNCICASQSVYRVYVEKR